MPSPRHRLHTLPPIANVGAGRAASWICCAAMLACSAGLPCPTSQAQTPPSTPRQEPPGIARRLPPTDGISLEPATRGHLRDKLAAVVAELAQQPDHPLEADIRVLTKAVDLALRHNEFYSPNDVERAEELLEEAERRLRELQDGRSSWTRRTGLVVRGYRSRIDGSPQPYGLEIPADIDFESPVPLYVWLHGRGDKATDLHFLHTRMKRPGKIAPPHAIVVHPFGRHCVGFKSAGEIDVLEVVEHVRSQYAIDPHRIVLIGFSMGGAGAWHIGAHYTDHWVAMSPGAGFAETALYNRLQPDDFPAWYEQRLWSVYDVPAYVRNLFNLPVIAYSGEKDRQIQAARVMEAAFEREGRRLTHLIGPGMGHQYHPQTLAELLDRLQTAAARGRDRRPDKLFLQTRTLRYGRMHWVQLLGLQRHWQDTRVDAAIVDDRTLRLDTKNVRRLQVQPLDDHRGMAIHIDGQELTVPSGNSPIASLVLAQDQDGWRIELEPDGTPRDGSGAAGQPVRLAKRPGLQGPIDDAFLEPFLVVTPSGKAAGETVDGWVRSELEHFRRRWRALMRGELREKPDDQVTADDLERYHVVVWGDAASNSLLRRALQAQTPQPPLHWTRDSLGWAETSYDAAHHVPVFVYPNPLNPRKYLVCNSGLTFREGHDRTNSLQNPKLPDWAILDIRQPPDELTAGRVVVAGFFDESWQWQPPPTGRGK